MDSSVDRDRTTLNTIFGYGLRLIPLIFLGIFFFYPLAAILQVSLLPEGQLDLSGFFEIAGSAYYRDTFLFTVGQAVLSTLLTVGLALPGAYVFARYRFPGKSLLMSLATLPFVLPTVVVAVAFTALIGNNGVLNDILITLFNLDAPPIQLQRTLAIILIVHVFYNYAIALRMISGYWLNQNRQIEEAARVLGCSGIQLFLKITLPLLRPAIMAASVLVFIFTFTSFGVILILGGLRFATLEVEIYQQALNLFDLPTAAALSLVQIGVMFLMMVFYTRIQRETRVSMQSAETLLKSPGTTTERVIVGLNIGLIVVLLLMPLLALVWRSVISGGEISFQNYLNLWENTRQSISFVPPIVAVGNSLLFAVVTTVLATLLGILTAYLIRTQGRLSRIFDPLFMLPLATSAVTLGFGYIITLNNVINALILIPIVHTLVALPFVVRSVLPALRAIDTRITDAASVLGASPFNVIRRIELPLVSRGIIVGATFAFTISMGEFGASLFLARPQSPTLPVTIFRFINQPGIANYGQALAMSVILMTVCAVAFVLIERIRTVGVGDF